MQQMVNERIGRHELICLLGEGGMAEVYLAFSRGLADVKKLVVLKVIRRELARDKRFVTMFLDEARLATRLNHPNVVHSYEALEEDGRYVLSMEYLEGQSLFEVFQRIDLRYFPLEQHLWILTQVLAGLQYAHALPDYNGSPLGVVHRDVSPDNTFVTYDGEVKLLDFGIAKASGAVSVTNRGTFKGKLAYCAPEQLQGEECPDARADIFAVGVMLWEALAGRRIEVGDGYPQSAHIRVSGKDPRIREVRPDVVPALADMCDRAMALRPGDRYLSAVDFQRELERYLEESGKRVGRSQLAELMRGHFDIERRCIQKLIKDHLGATRAGVAVAPRQAPLSGWSRCSASVMDGPGEGELRPRRLRTEETGAPPAGWARRSSVSPAPVEVPVAPAPVGAPAHPGPRQLLGGRLLTMVMLGAVMIGCVGIAMGLWELRPSLASNPPVLPETPVSVAPPVSSVLPVRPPVPVAPPFSRSVAFNNDVPSDIQLSPEKPAARSPAHAGGKPHLRSGRGRAGKATARPRQSAAQAVRAQAPAPDADTPAQTWPSDPIDERNPYVP